MKLVSQVLIPLVCSSLLPAQAQNVSQSLKEGFVHPGLSHKLSDLERMKYMVKQKKEPWISSFTRLNNVNSFGRCDYKVRGSQSITTLDATNRNNYDKFKYDGMAAYHNALLWAITGETCHAEKAVEIFNSWSHLTGLKSGGTRSLDAGRVIWKMLEGAEIIKATYSGWKPADIQAFSDMLVYPGYSTTTVPEKAIKQQQVTFYWNMYNGDPGRHGNQGLFGFRGIMAMGIFLDNHTMYQRALRYLKGESHPDDDLPYQAGPFKVSDKPDKTTEFFDEYKIRTPDSAADDYGFNEQISHYIWPNGQGQESSRDQGHALLGVSILVTMAEMAWNQGDDLYGFLNHRILSGLEYFYKYNLSYVHKYDDQPIPWEPTAQNGEFLQKKDRSGRWYSKEINPYFENSTAKTSRGTMVYAEKAPIGEMALGHYRDRLGLDQDKYLWTERAWQLSIDKTGYYERAGTQVDHPGWGGLTERRAPMSPGDPVQLNQQNNQLVYQTHLIPGTIEAEDFDQFATGGEGHTYHDSDPQNHGGAYRPDEGVDLYQVQGRTYVGQVNAGEWLGYTVEVTSAGTYTINLTYQGLASGSKIKIMLGKQDLTGQVSLPATHGKWSTLTLVTGVKLPAGMANLRIYFSGKDQAIRPDAISFK
ncbi:Carbohydrate binding module (family 6) [Vibrio aerogenes CECT 7868]|uniref:Carbohydrate binding module (Family 6) n=1 Tax=Vibrio aerogenes CECT 7868 TaxID=1216006 RepID=A0A1M5ZSF6_9VIBR|nr:carbohydrate-binding protein [Vibrio aerogenes]SHI26853.1 Carbohydrate binding module (family 6) [Vibrio aerogenes CECT 7868]